MSPPAPLLLIWILVFFISFPQIIALPSKPNPQLPKSLINGAVIITHHKIAVSKTNLAIKALSFPNFISLVFGNMINSFKPMGPAFQIFHSAKKTTEIYPLLRKLDAVDASGFIFKRSTLDIFPVPMENALFVVRLRPISSRYAVFHLWIVHRGIYTKLQKARQKLHAKSLLRDFGDNFQRSLGVAACPNYPTISGLCNNRVNTLSGVTIQELRKDMPHARLPTPQLVNIEPGPRRISNAMFKQEAEKLAPLQTNALLVFFGQFIDHEIVSTPADDIDKESAAAISHPQSTRKMAFTRSGILRFSYSHCCAVSYSKQRLWERTPFNVLTSFIDGSAIYGSQNLRAHVLRSFRGGELIVKQRGGEYQLPFNTLRDLPFKLGNEGEGEFENLFVAGDVRANENPFLLSIHVAFVREHNRVCRMLRFWLQRQRKSQFLKDNWLYKQARQIVIAELQSITFNEFVPAILGKGALGKYKGYRPRVDARISTFHSSFAYRWGHSGVPESFIMKNRRGQVKKQFLKNLFFSTKVYKTHGLDNIILGAMNTAAANIDLTVVESLRDFLFHEEAGVLDLVALNIQRARDFGAPSYLSIQGFFKTGNGLDNIEPSIQRKLLKVYGSANKIDAFVGGLAETTKKGSILGPLFHAINADQFRRLRDGDRFYYENMIWKPMIAQMPLVKRIRKHQIRFADVLFANTGISKAQVGFRSSVFKLDPNK